MPWPKGKRQSCSMRRKLAAAHRGVSLPLVVRRHQAIGHETSPVTAARRTFQRLGTRRSRRAS